MKMKKLKFLLALYLALCTIFNAVMFNYITAYASTNSGMTQEQIDRANGLYGKGNWSYDSENDLVVPTEDAQKNLGDFLLTGFGVARKAVGDGLDWYKTYMQDIINKNFDYIAIKNDLLYIPEKCLDELHDSIKNDSNITKLQGYYFLEPNMSKNDVKGAYISNIYPIGTANYQAMIDEYSDFNMYVTDRLFTSRNERISVYLFPNDNFYPYISRWVTSTDLGTYPDQIMFLDAHFKNIKVEFIRFSDSSSGKLLSDSFCDSPFSPDFYGYCGQPLKIFYSASDAQIYINQLKGIGSQNLFISQNFYNYKSNALNIDINKLHSTNWTTQNQNIYNEVINNRNETMVRNNVDVLTDVDFQAVIDSTIKKYMYQNSGGGDEPGGGGGSGSGGTLVVPEETQNVLEQIYSVLSSMSAWIEPIYDRVGDILTETRNLQNELFVRTNSIADELKNILKAIKDISISGTGGSLETPDSIQSLIDLLETKFTELFKILESFDFESGGKSIFDYLLEWLLNQADHFGNFLDTLLGNLLADIILFFIGDGGLTGAVLVPAKSLASETKSRFPTSIPWDIIAIIDVFSAVPEIPHFELPFSIPKLGIDEKIVIDFEKAENLGKLSRSMFEVTFLLFLVIQTRKLYGSVNSN